MIYLKLEITDLELARKLAQHIVDNNWRYGKALTKQAAEQLTAMDIADRYKISEVLVVDE